MKPINLTTLFTSPLNNTAQIQQTRFKGSGIQTFGFNGFVPLQDNFVSNPLGPSLNAAEIERLAKSSPRIMALLKEYNIPLKVNIEALENMIKPKGHMSVTRVIAAGIYSSLPEELKEQVNLNDIQKAAKLHDYGKVLIPKEILEKKGALSPEEKKIMELHSEFGYELLKLQGVNENVLKLVKYHHQKPDGSGYPAIDDDFEYDISAQIIEAADIYSALRENRSYHKACSKDKAFEAIQAKVYEGVISQEVFDALKNYVKFIPDEEFQIKR